MGLDQSIFTTSKAIAQAIYEGNISDDALWNDAFFSLRNIVGAEGWTDMDRYAKNRRAQCGWIDETPQIDVLGIDTAGFTMVVTGEDGDAIPSEEREANLKMVGSLGTQGIDGLAEHSFYQIGLFEKFSGLHGWFLRRFADYAEHHDGGIAFTVLGVDAELTGPECLNDTMILMNSDDLSALITDALKVLQAFDVSQELGELFAKGTFPTCNGCFFGSTEYDEAYLADLANLAAFAYSVISLPDAENALFAYNPWW